MQKYINTIVKKALDEDLKPHGDITTNLISFKNKKTKAQIIAKQNGVIAGLDFCKAAFKLVGKETVFTSKVKDGAKVKKNKVIAEIKAKTKTILIAERTGLNFLNHASGIATLTNQFQQKVNKQTKICCTRKTTPNLRQLEKYAVKKGGGFNHRYNLSDNVQADNPNVEFIKPCNLCPYMKKINLQKILDCLENETNEIFIEEKMAKAARQSVQRMTEIGR